MPELPEVETITRQLKKNIEQKIITRISIKEPTIVHPQILSLLPLKIEEVFRRGKWILWKTPQHTIITHLRMSGHFYYQPKKEPKYTVATFLFDDNSLLTHNSIRKFGSMKVYSKEDLIYELQKLGPEPLEMSLHQFSHFLQRKNNANIKAALLDQRAVAGIGNIYAQEILYHANVHPQRKISTLSKSDQKSLYSKTKEILQKAIAYNGTTIQSYSHTEGTGTFQQFLSVYHKKQCPKGHKIESIVQGQRSTYYCPKCQR